MKAIWVLSGLILPLILGVQSAIAQVAFTVNSAYGANALDLDGQGSASSHIVKVADLHISTSNPQGFTLTIASVSLTKTGGTDIDFEVATVADGADTPASSDFVAASDHSYTYSTNKAGEGDRDLYIRYTPHAFQDPGNYIATIQMMVTDN